MVGSLFLVFALMIREVFDKDFGEERNDIFVGSEFIINLYLFLLIITFVVSISVEARRIDSIYKFLGI